MVSPDLWVARRSTVDATIAKMKDTSEPQNNALAQAVHDSTLGPIDRKYLVRLVLEQYVFHAAPYVRVIGDRPVLPRAYASTVASAVWLDATGSAVPPSASSRTPTLTSIGQYLSRLARVASDPFRGMDDIRTPARFKLAEGRSAAKRRVGLGDNVDSALEKLENTLNADERQAIQTVRRIILENRAYSEMIIQKLMDAES